MDVGTKITCPECGHVFATCTKEMDGSTRIAETELYFDHLSPFCKVECRCGHQFNMRTLIMDMI